MDLQTLNNRWKDTGKPHAVAGEGGLWHWFCPDCELGGRTDVVLHTAMSDSLAHKGKCAKVD